MRKATIFLALAFLLLCATPVYAQLALPHAFYGSVKINGSPAPPRTEVEARGPGVITGIKDNPTITTVPGIYGTANPFEHRLIVQGDIVDGTTITFYVNGVSTGQTAEWREGETSRKDLSVTIAAPPPAPPTGVGALPPPAPPLGTTDVTGKVTTTGRFTRSVTATSEDELCTLTIPRDTVGLTEELEPLDEITMVIMDEPPPPPEDANIVGLAYDFGPDGATFDPPITLEYSYDPDDIPEGIAEEDLVLAMWDEEAGEWVELPCTVDPVTHTITASVSHFTTFAVVARRPVPPPPAPAPAAFSVSDLTIQPAEVQPKEAVTISVSVANTGGTEGSYTVVLKINGVKEAEKGVTVAAGHWRVVSFSVSKDIGSYSVVVDGLRASFTVVVPAPPAPAPPLPAPPVKPPFNWPLVGGIMAGVVVLTLLVFFFVIRPRIKEY